jgi:hypothetical protein
VHLHARRPEENRHSSVTAIQQGFAALKSLTINSSAIEQRLNID